MIKVLSGVFAAVPVLWLSGCGASGNKSARISMVYAAAALLSLLILLGYRFLVKRRAPLFFMLFASVTVVNTGYWMLSVSRTLEQALWANRLSYLGSVFLPLWMLLIILDTLGIRCSKRRKIPLFLLGAGVFFIAASPGFLSIYYREVSLSIVNGTTVLEKVYGPLHPLYGLYLLAYFSIMVAFVLRAAVRKKAACTGHVVILSIAVFVNLCVWFLEQLFQLNFEFLSISYIISELFLLGLHLLLTEQRIEPPQTLAETPSEKPAKDDRSSRFLMGLTSLTPTERAVYEAHITRMTTKEILVSLNIKENTLKFHNKNLYHKLGVSSRKELQEIYAQLGAEQATEAVQDPNP